MATRRTEVRAPSVVAMVKRLPGDQGMVDSQSSIERTEVQALFKGMDTIDMEEANLAPTQVLPSQCPGSFPSGPTAKRRTGSSSPYGGGSGGETTGAKVASKGARRVSISSAESDDSGDEAPSFIRRVRQEWEAESERRTPESLGSEVVRDLKERLEAAKVGTVEASAQKSGMGVTPTPDELTTPSRMATLEARRWNDEIASAYSSAIPSGALESAQRPRELATSPREEAVSAPMPVATSPLRGPKSTPGEGALPSPSSATISPPLPSGPKAWREVRAVAKEEGKQQHAPLSGPKMVCGQKLPRPREVDGKRLDLKGNGRKRKPEAGEAWVEVLDSNRPPSGKTMKGIRVRTIQVKYDGKYSQERRIQLEPQEPLGRSSSGQCQSGTQESLRVHVYVGA
ncbi:hypothetical protein EV426DRAFT_700020 [Tirmania nivea]|nr:hypothetical protein EV426DRAFT_700020 [Tirmania nivea]